jgi:hypothetical protein
MNCVKTITTGILGAFLVFLAGTAGAVPSVWPNQKGEFCVLNLDTDGIAQIAVQKTVGINYSVQGVTYEENGTTLFSGNAVFVDNIAYMNISGSGYDSDDDEVHGIIAWVELDFENEDEEPDGWVKMVGFHCTGQVDGCEFSNDGTQDLAIVSCDLLAE